MKKIILIVHLVLICYKSNSKNSCEERVFYVSNLTELDQRLNFLVSNSGIYGTTIILRDGEYGNRNIHWSDEGEIGLWKNISPKGGCPCEIKAETKGNVTLYGKLFWRIRDAKNLTVDGITFIKTRKHFAKGLIDISGSSQNIKIINCTFKELKEIIPTVTGGFFDDPDPTNDINYYVHLGGSNNSLKNSNFRSKYSNGTYINMYKSLNNSVIGCYFTEEADKTEAEMKWNKERDFIYLTLCENSEISKCDFNSKKTKGHYVNFNGGNNNIVKECNFTENPSHYPITLEWPLYGGFETNTSYINFYKGSNNKAISNIFGTKRIYGNYVDASTFDGNLITGHQIIENVFNSFDLGGYKASFIKLGSCGASYSRPETDAGIRVVNNIFKNYNSSESEYYEIISNKSSGNFFIGNTFEDCNGSLKLRCGNNCTVIGNRFLGKDQSNNFMEGIDISGTDHKIYNNYFEGLTRYPISLIGGNLRPSTVRFSYTPIRRLELSFNTFVNCNYNILVRQYPNEEATILPQDSKFDNNIFHFTTEIGSTFFSLYPSSNINQTTDLDVWNTNVINNNIFYSNSSKDLINIESFSQPFNYNYFIDPMLSNSSGEYIPSLNSIAKNNAKNNGYSYVIDDINNFVRGSNKDIGCYELNDSSIQKLRIFNSSLIDAVNIFPNPVSNYLKINCVDCENVNIDVISTLGEIYFTAYYSNLNTVELDISKIPNRVFFVRVRSSEINKTYKIIKSN